MYLNPFKSPDMKNPADSAMPYYDQVPGAMKPYYNNYIGAGNNALNTLMEQYSGLLSNPGGAMNQMGQSFQQSPGYQFQVNQATNASNNAAAAGGMLGTGAHQFNSASMVNNLANQDYYNWMGNVLGLFGQGLQGTQGINQMGYGASDTLAQALASNLMNQGNLAFQGTANQNQMKADRYNRDMGLLGAIPGAVSGFL